MQLNQKIETGEVIELLPPNMAKIRIKRHSQCIGCSQRSLCDPFGKDYMIISAKNLCMAKIGDEVEVSFELVRKGQAIVILYIIPLILFIVGALIGNFIDPFNNKDLSSSLMGILCLIISFIGIFIYNKILVKEKPSLEPRIKRILNSI